jgi:hypothetical protein
MYDPSNAHMNIIIIICRWDLEGVTHSLTLPGHRMASRGLGSDMKVKKRVRQWNPCVPPSWVKVSFKTRVPLLVDSRTVIKEG